MFGPRPPAARAVATRVPGPCAREAAVESVVAEPPPPCAPACAVAAVVAVLADWERVEVVATGVVAEGVAGVATDGVTGAAACAGAGPRPIA
jgi:hypothetical protein